MNVGQSSPSVVVGTTDELSFVNPSEPSTEVPDLNVDMENDEHEELEKSRSHIQETKGVGRSIEADERRFEIHGPTNPFTSHKVDANVTGQKTAERRKQHEVDQGTQYMANALSGLSALYSKNEQLMMKQMQKFEIFIIQVVGEATNVTIESQEMIAKMNIDA